MDSMVGLRPGGDVVGARTPEGLIRRRGPLLSSEIIAALQKGGASSEAARKRLSRAVASGAVRRVMWLRFPHNERMHYLDDQLRSDQYFEAVWQATAATGSVYGHALGALLARGGVAPASQLQVISGCPDRLHGQLAAEAVVRNLQRVELLERVSDPTLGELLAFSKHVARPVIGRGELRARLLAEDILIGALKDWLRNVGFVSYNRVRTRPSFAAGECPDFAHFRWDLTAPSYVHPLASRGKGSSNPGFVALDVLLGETLDLQAVKYFLHKCAVVRNQAKVRPYLSMLLATRFTPEALRAGRSAGVIFATPSAILGKDVGRALEGLISVMSDAAKVAAADPARVEKLMSELGRIEGAAGNLRGPLFELIVGMCTRSFEGASLDMGVTAMDPATGLSADIDVFLVHGKTRLTAIECKGRQPSSVVHADEVDDWLTRQIPRIHSWTASQPRFSGQRLTVAFWTSGSFSPDALARLRAAQAATRRYAIDWKDGVGVAEYVTDSKEKYAERLFREHFANHPLADR